MIPLIPILMTLGIFFYTRNSRIWFCENNRVPRSIPLLISYCWLYPDDIHDIPILRLLFQFFPLDIAWPTPILPKSTQVGYSWLCTRRDIEICHRNHHSFRYKIGYLNDLLCFILKIDNKIGVFLLVCNFDPYP